MDKVFHLSSVVIIFTSSSQTAQNQEYNVRLLDLRQSGSIEQGQTLEVGLYKFKSWDVTSRAEVLLRSQKQRQIVRSNLADQRYHTIGPYQLCLTDTDLKKMASRIK